MGAMQRRKGATGEREFAEQLRESGFDARRGQQFHGGADSPDVISEQLKWMHFEVKRVEALSISNACQQAERDASGKPWAVAHRKNNEPWYITIRLDFFVKLLRCFLKITPPLPKRK